jgi:hypothetical protein
VIGSDPILGERFLRRRKLELALADQIAHVALRPIPQKQTLVERVVMSALCH